MAVTLPERIVSGGQTGVDRAALDAALALGLPCGGWCPQGRRAEDGQLPARYPLRETPLPRPQQRTVWNVRDSDATLILAPRPLTGGTALTRKAARRLGRPFLIADPFSPDSGNIAAVRTWLAEHRSAVLNVAGPRESESPGIHGAARVFLEALWGSAEA